MVTTMIYLVEAVDPKQGRERKALVRRWIVLAANSTEAIDMVVAELVKDICNSEDNQETRFLVENRVRAECHWTAKRETPVYRLRNELR